MQIAWIYPGLGLTTSGKSFLSLFITGNYLLAASEAKCSSVPINTSLSSSPVLFRKGSWREYMIDPQWIGGHCAEKQLWRCCSAASPSAICFPERHDKWKTYHRKCRSTELASQRIPAFPSLMQTRHIRL